MGQVFFVPFVLCSVSIEEILNDKLLMATIHDISIGLEQALNTSIVKMSIMILFAQVFVLFFSFFT